MGGYDVKDIERSTLTVGHDAWIGCRVIITSKCSHIGNGVVIGAGSIVTKDVPDGSPARVSRLRFDTNTIELMEKSQWWELTPDQLMKFYPYIQYPAEYAKKIIEYRRISDGI